MQPEIVPQNDRLGMVGLSIVESRKGNKEAKAKDIKRKTVLGLLIATICAFAVS